MDCDAEKTLLTAIFDCDSGKRVRKEPAIDDTDLAGVLLGKEDPPGVVGWKCNRYRKLRLGAVRERVDDILLRGRVTDSRDRQDKEEVEKAS